MANRYKRCEVKFGGTTQFTNTHGHYNAGRLQTVSDGAGTIGRHFRTDSPMKLKILLPCFGITAICGIVVGAVQAAHLDQQRQVAVSLVLLLFSTAPCVFAMFLRQTQPERYGIDLVTATLGIYTATLLLSGFIGALSAALFVEKWG